MSTDSNALSFPYDEAPVPGAVQTIADGVLWLRMPLPFHRLPETEHGVYATLLQTGQALQTAKGIPADRQLLRLARRLGALVVSRDSFRDHRSRYRRLIDEPGRLLGGFVENGALFVPGLEVTAPLIRP